MPLGLSVPAARSAPFASRRPCVAPRPVRTAAALDPAAPHVRVEKLPDGTVTYHFGGEADKEQFSSAAGAEAHQAAAPSPPLAAVLDAVAAAAAAAAQPSHALASPAPAPPEPAAGPPPGRHLGHSNGTGSSDAEQAGSASSNGAPARRQRQQREPAEPAHAAAQLPALDGRRGAAAQDEQRQKRQLAEQQRGRERGGRPASQAQSSAAPPASARGIDYQAAEVTVVLAEYEALCDAGDLDEALQLIKECIRAGRSDVLAKLRHYRFLRPAASQRAVKQAMRFVQLLPRQFVDLRTYNMLLRVCAQSGDLRNALHVADMLQATGLKMDGILYTTLISACASVGDAEKAFQLYSDMRAAGVPADKMVFASVVKACAERIGRLPHSERRQQLVLLERAFGLVEDMKAARIPADAAVWNALVVAAGRAGQLQRAFNVLEDMLGMGMRPNDRTYASLIDACARAADKGLALRVYRKALREGCGGTLMVYSAAINACVQAHDGCDSETAMAVYADMQRNGVEPDSQLYAMLMKAAGAVGDIDLALGLQEEMQREGLRPCQGTESALMAVFIRNGQLPDAQRIYRQLRAAGEWPAPYALNALLNIYANSFRLGDVVSLVCEMAAGGLRPDLFTFSAIFNACQRADEAELALDVARVMKLRGVRMDETCAAILLRICYNRLRQQWVPGGYPPHRPQGTASTIRGAGGLPGSKRSQERQRLLEALTPRSHQVDVREPLEIAWLSQAFNVYREAVAAGVKPTMRMLNRVLMCLRVAWEGKQPDAEGGASVSAESLLPHHHPARLGAFSTAQAPPALGMAESGAAGVKRQEKVGVESVYHVQAVSIMEEAIISNVVPSFKMDSDEPIDLRGMPPAVAEVYVLTVLSAMQRLCEARRVISQNLVFLVPEYDGSKVFMPSHLSHVDYEQIAAVPGQPSYEDDVDSEDAEGAGPGYGLDDSDAAFARAASGADPADDDGSDAYRADERTGLGVAGVLRRLRLWAREYGERGFILLEAKEITRWCKATQRAVERRSASALPVQKPYGQPFGGRPGLQQQQREIRTRDDH